MKKIIILTISIFLLTGFCNNTYGKTSNKIMGLKHKYPESAYQHFWCSKNKGIEEFKNKDKTRVDCLTATHAVEFDFAYKWVECVGQALHYQKMTGKRAKTILILEDLEKQMIYFERIKDLSEIYNFDAEYRQTGHFQKNLIYFKGG